MDNTKKELNTREELDDFTKIEVFDKYMEVRLERDQKAIQVEELLATIEQMQELLRLGQSKTYGTSSEKNIDQEIEQLSFFEEGHQGVFNEPEVYVEKATHTRRKQGYVGPNKPCFDHLPVEEVIEELAPEDQFCDTCHSPLLPMKMVERVEICIKPARLYKRVIKTQLYVCRTCEENGANPIKSSSTQLPVFSGSYASASLLAYAMAKKYWEKVPIHRLEKQFFYSGIQISRALLSKWIIDGSHLYLRGLYDRLHEELLKGAIIQADETPLQVLKEPGRKPKQNSYMWHYVSGHLEPRQISLYEYQPGRSGDYARQFLNGFGGFLQTDGYSGYKKVTEVTSVGCFAHARRKFVEAIKAMGKETTDLRGTLAFEGLDFNDRLFKLEREFSNMSPKERYEARLKKSKPLLEAYKAWLYETRKKVVQRSKLGEAITYSLNQWPQLIAFLEDGALEISNNRAERGIKEFVIGRKNFLFSTSVAGARASEVIYSIVETAKANKLHPYEYIKYIIEELSQNRQTSEKLDELLPWSEKLPDHVRIKPGIPEEWKHLDSTLN